MASGSNTPPPAERASEIINKLPSSPNLITKTGSVILGTGLLATAISQELYVVNEETVIGVGFLILATFIAKVCIYIPIACYIIQTLSAQSLSGPYSGWADGHIQRIKDILNNARAEHTQTVKDRIASVEKMKDVVSITEGLFAISKDTAKLESEIFVERQKVALASEVKAVLDSWVRYEQQAKESEQAELAKTVIDNVLKSIKDEKTQRDILAGAVAEVEREY